MADYCDSPAYQDNPVFRMDDTALQIQLYYDDLEVVNPLGSNTKVHKLGELMHNAWGTQTVVCTYI